MKVDNLVLEDQGLAAYRIFNSEEIWRLEMERIFSKAWAYLAHESEIPNPGDYVLREMANNPVIVVRGDDGKIRAFANLCTHRGILLCRSEAGNSKQFVCPYHGWTFDTKGQLVATAHRKDFYEGKMDFAQWGLIAISQVDQWQGFIFGCLDATSPSLQDYLGDATWYMDLYFNRTPQGMEVLGPPQKWVIPMNWKYGAMNFGADGPHAAKTHGPITLLTFQIPQPVIVDALLKSPAVCLENGHSTILVQMPEGGPDYLGLDPELVALYEKKLSPEQQTTLKRILVGVQTNFPNMSWVHSAVTFSPDEVPVMFLNVRVWQPKGPLETEIWSWYFVEKEASEDWKDKVRKSGVRTFAAGGTFDQDDAEVWAASGLSLQSPLLANRYANFQGILPYKDRAMTNFPGPGRVYPSTYSEISEFNVLVGWKKMMGEVQ